MYTFSTVDVFNLNTMPSLLDCVNDPSRAGFHGSQSYGTGGYHKIPDTATGIRRRMVRFCARWSWYAVPYDCVDYKRPTIQRERTTQYNNIAIETFFSPHFPRGSSAMSTGRLVAEKLRTYFSVAVSGCHRLPIAFETLLLCLRRVLSDPS